MSLAFCLNLFHCITNQLQDDLTLTGQSYGSRFCCCSDTKQTPATHTVIHQRGQSTTAGFVCDPQSKLGAPGTGLHLCHLHL